MTLHELGISQADQKILTDSVSVVFHSAATVKFDEALKLSVAMNILGTKRVVQLCHKMLKLQVSCTAVPQDAETAGQFRRSSPYRDIRRF